MRATVSSSHIVSTTSSFAGAALTLLPCSIVGYLPWKTVLPEFLQCGFFPWAALLHELLQCWSPAWGAILQAQTAAAWVLWRVRSPASKPAPVQAPLSMGPLVLPEACPE